MIARKSQQSIPSADMAITALGLVALSTGYLLKRFAWRRPSWSGDLTEFVLLAAGGFLLGSLVRDVLRDVPLRRSD
jgi:hypothetical protein